VRKLNITALRINRQSLLYMLGNLGSKGLAAAAQLTAIFVFTRMHSQDEAALIFLLLGYTIWFYVFECGLSQTLQNKFNAKQVTVDDMLTMAVVHYVGMLIIAALVVTTPFLTDILLPASRSGAVGVEVKAFSIGAAILLIASNNLITQRLLLIFNKGRLGNILIMCQSALAITGLACYEIMGHPNLIMAVILYLGPQVLVFLPMLLGWIIRLVGKPSRMGMVKVARIFYDSLGFWGLAILAAVFLGSDYYFAAHYMSSEQIVSYHVATRLFFFSFVAYFAFLMHRARRLSGLSLQSGVRAVSSIVKDSVLIGLVSVLLVYVAAAILEQFGAFNGITDGVGIGHELLFSAFMYFMIRVCRDVGVIVAGLLNARAVMYKVYTLEVVVGLSLMYLIVPTYGGQGIFFSLTLACTLGLALLIYEAKKLGITFTRMHCNENLPSNKRV